MASKEIIAGQAAVFVQLRDKLFRDQVRNLGTVGRTIGTQLTQFGAGLTALGTGAAAAVARSAAVFSSFGDAVDKVAARTGLTAEAVSELGFAAGLSGSSVQALEKATQRMQKNLLDAATGGTQANEAFARLGLSVDKLLASTTDEKFLKIADAIANVKDPSLQAAAAMEVFGKSGQSLIPLLAGGSKAIADMRAEARRLGISITQSDAASAAVLNDAWSTVAEVFRGVQLQIGAAVAPAISDLSLRVAEAGGVVARFVRDNRELVAGLAATSVAAVGIGGSLTALGLSLRAVSSGFSAVSAAASSLPIVGAAIGAVLSPLGLLAAGIAAAGVAFINFTETGREMGRTISAVFGNIAGIAQRTLESVSQAISGGDLVGAVQAAWGGIQTIAQQAWDGIVLVTLQAVEAIRESFPGLVANVTQAWQDLVSVTSTAWNAVQSVVVGAWESVSQFVVDAWNNAVDGVSSVTGAVSEVLVGYFGDIGRYWSEVTDGMFDSWADFTASVQTLWADAGTFLLRKTLEITRGMLDTFAAIGEFLAGDNFVSASLRDAAASVEAFRENVIQGGEDRRQAIEQSRERRVAEAQAIQQRQATQFQSQIADLREKLAIANVEQLAVPANVLNSLRDARGKFDEGIDLSDDIKQAADKFEQQSVGSFSAREASLLGARLQDSSASRQRAKMVDFLAVIAKNTVKEQRQAV